MKKILALILCTLILIGGLIGCKKPSEPDPHEGLYGTYKMVSAEKDGIEVKSKGSWISRNNWPEEIKDYIQEMVDIVGDTISITKDTIKFSGGSMEPEFEYEFRYSDWIRFDYYLENGKYFPFNSVRYDSFETITSTKYQLVTFGYLEMEETNYSIQFYYSRSY